MQTYQELVKIFYNNLTAIKNNILENIATYDYSHSEIGSLYDEIEKIVVNFENEIRNLNLKDPIIYGNSEIDIMGKDALLIEVCENASNVLELKSMLQNIKEDGEIYKLFRGNVYNVTAKDLADLIDEYTSIIEEDIEIEDEESEENEQ